MLIRPRTVSRWLCVLGIMAGCGVDSNASPESLQTQALVAAPDQASQGESPAGGADDAAALCEDHFDDLMGADCGSCLQAACGACDGDCRTLVTCAAEQCAADADSLACTVAECGACAGASGLLGGLNLAHCAASNCMEVCPLLAQTGIQPSEPVPAPEPVADGCREDTAAAVGDECLQCAQDLCEGEMMACDGPCQALITCAVDECGGGQDVACISANCGSCLGAAGPAQNVGGCLQRNCAEVCPVNPPPTDEEPVDGVDDKGEPGGDDPDVDIDGSEAVDPGPVSGGGSVGGAGATGATGTAPGTGGSAQTDDADPTDSMDRADRPRGPQRHFRPRGIMRWFRQLLRHIFG